MPEQEQLAFPTLLEFIQSTFHADKVVEEDGEFFVNTVLPQNKIFLFKGYEGRTTYLLAGLRASAISMQGRVEEAIDILQKATQSTLRYFAPLFFECPNCGVLSGSPVSTPEDTMVNGGLSGHSGNVLICTRCGAKLGLDPRDSHEFS